MILVTGATGNVGGAAVRQLHRAGEPVRALVRDPSRARLPDGAEVVRGDLGDPASLENALKGVDSVFLVWPMEPEPASAAVDAISRHAGAVAYLSAAGADQPEDPITSNHAALEALVRNSGLRWTVIRGGSFATNDLQWVEQIRSGGSVLRIPFAESRPAVVHEGDLASVGVRALTAPGLEYSTPVVTGPEQLTGAERIGIIGQALGRELRVETMSPAETRAELLEAGLPEEYADAIVEAHLKSASPDHVEPVHPVDAVTGEPPRTYRQWVADHLEDFR